MAKTIEQRVVEFTLALETVRREADFLLKELARLKLLELEGEGGLA